MKKIIIILTAAAFLQFCEKMTKKDNIETGISEKHLEDGSVMLVATSMASENSIQKGKTSMMRTTSCDAAKLLLKNKIKEITADKNSDSYSFGDVELLGNGKYCRIRVVLSRSEIKDM